MTKQWMWIIALAFLFLLSGCQKNNQAIPPSNNPVESQSLAHDNSRAMTNEEAREVADRLTKLATQVDDVHDATAVVAGRFAVVGIDVDAKLDRSRVGNIKYTVAEALKADPMGAYAIVTADADTNYRLRQMAQNIRDGHPLEGVMEELAAIVGRLMPQAPRNVEQPEKNPQTESNLNEELGNFGK